MSQQASGDGEESGGAQAIHFDRGPDKDQMAAQFMPEEHDWVAKTRLDVSDPQAVAALQNFGRMYPEVEDLQDLIDDFTMEFLKGRTAVAGQGRQEYVDIIRSMFGGSSEEERQRWMQALGVDSGED